MKYSPKQYAEALHSLIEGAPANRTEVIKRFATYLIRQRAQQQLDRIASAYDHLANTPTERQPIMARVRNMEEATVLKKLFGNNPRDHFEIDDAVIAGAQITQGDTRIDSTVERRLSNIKKALTSR